MIKFEYRLPPGSAITQITAVLINCYAGLDNGEIQRKLYKNLCSGLLQQS
jgi:hypothetical protein